MKPEQINISMGIEYDGSKFHGWESQPNLRTIQEVVEDALSIVANHPIKVTVSGRTDRGVHAKEQVIHFATTAQRSEYSWIRGGVSNLPDDVTILWAREMPAEFHARFSAVARHYQYQIINQPVRPAINRDTLTWEYRKLDAEKMHQAAQYLLGEHNFNSLRASACQAHSPVRTITKISVVREGVLIKLDVTANAFLQHMVRNIVGVLIAIGCGEKPIEWIVEVLKQKDRRAAGITAPPNGLYLMDIQY